MRPQRLQFQLTHGENGLTRNCFVGKHSKTYLLAQEFKRIGCRLCLALHEGVPRAMDHHSSGCLPAEKFPTSASDRQDRGATTLLGSHRPFHLTRPRDVAQEESPAYGDGSAL